jgi:hypothetical protein
VVVAGFYTVMGSNGTNRGNNHIVDIVDFLNSNF